MLKAGDKHLWSRMSSEQMEEERTQHEVKDLWEQIFSRENLFAALSRVQANAGAVKYPFCDDKSLRTFGWHIAGVAF